MKLHYKIETGHIGHDKVGEQVHHIAHLNFVSFKNDFCQKYQRECVKRGLIAKARRHQNGNLEQAKSIPISFFVLAGKIGFDFEDCEIYDSQALPECFWCPTQLPNPSPFLLLLSKILNVPSARMALKWLKLSIDNAVYNEFDRIVLP